MRKILSFLLCLVLASPLFAENLVLINGIIIDGTLKNRFPGNVRVRDGKITDVGVFKPAANEMVLDVKGLIVAPGFIDLRNPSAEALEKNPSDTSQVTRGITTAVLGSDGSGPYSVEDFMLPFDEKPAVTNILTFVGHGRVRRQIMGDDYKRAATADEIHRMGELVEDAMRQGAFGLSSDLSSDPGSYATTDELTALAKAMSRFGGTYITRVKDSIKEAVEIGRAAKVPVQISLSGISAQVLPELDKVRTGGVDVAADIDANTDRDVRAFLQHPWVLIAGDGFARVLGQNVREGKILTLERAVRKMTGLPASRVGLQGRGVLQKGAPADIAVFDPLLIRAESSMKYVFVNGTMVVKDGQPTDARPGQALR